MCRILFAAGAFFLYAAPSLAFSVSSPYVERGVLEIETKNRFDFDDRSSEDGFREHELEIKYGVNDWWAAELEGEWKKDPNDGYRYDVTKIENTFQLTETGEYLIDAGLKATYEFKHPAGSADKAKVKLLLAKKFSDTAHVANIGLEQELFKGSRNRNPEFEFSWKSRYNYTPLVNPGFEYYSGYGEFSDPARYDDQEQRLGPVIYGRLAPGVSYELGWLFGLSKSTEDHALKFNLEYEFPL